LAADAARGGVWGVVVTPPGETGVPPRENWHAPQGKTGTRVQIPYGVS
jgi:hypothetical protein